MYDIVNTSPFIEHPIVDISQFDAHEFDITIFEEEQPSNFLNGGIFQKELYCKCLLNKLFTLAKSKIKPFIKYQCDQMKEPIIWLNKFEKLIDINRDLFDDKDQVIRFDKALMVIELYREVIEKEEVLPQNVFDLNKVKSKLKEYNSYEEKLSYLCEMETEYKQLRPPVLNPHAVPFDEQINLEIEKLTKQETLKEKARAKGIVTTTTTNTKPLIKLKCNLNYYVDVFYQLSQEKQQLDCTLKDLAAYIASGVIDKEGNPVSVDSVYSMLKPSNFEKRPKGNSRFKLE